MEEKPSRAKKLTIATLRAVALMDLLAIPFGLGPVRGLAQNLPPPEDTRHSMLREAMLGLLTAQNSIPEIEARQHCLTLPVDAPNDRLQGPHGDIPRTFDWLRWRCISSLGTSRSYTSPICSIGGDTFAKPLIGHSHRMHGH